MSADFPEIDLRSICRNRNRETATVFLVPPYDGRRPWLHLGEVSLYRSHNHHTRHQWLLKAFLGDESAGRCPPTDFEHDSAYACWLPLIGVELDQVSYHQTHLSGFIDPSQDGRYPKFRVPEPGYDPRKHPDAVECDAEECLTTSVEDGGGPHIIVPEGLFVPPFNPKLYEAVRGKRVEIIIHSEDTA